MLSHGPLKASFRRASLSSASGSGCVASNTKHTTGVNALSSLITSVPRRQKPRIEECTRASFRHGGLTGSAISQGSERSAKPSALGATGSPDETASETE